MPTYPQTPAPGTRQAPVETTGATPAPRRTSPEERIRRQVEAIGAWNAARRLREAELATATSRQEREAASRELDVLRRVQHDLEVRTSTELARQGGPLLGGAPTAVIAHRRAWFAGHLSALLQEHGVDVVACTDNGADALGAVIAEQPDVLLAGDQLAMMTGADLLAGGRRFAPWTRCALHTSARPQGGEHEDVDVVLLAQDPPVLVVDRLLALVSPSLVNA